MVEEFSGVTHRSTGRTVTKVESFLFGDGEYSSVFEEWICLLGGFGCAAESFAVILLDVAYNSV